MSTPMVMQQAKVFNTDGELVMEGECELQDGMEEASFQPSLDSRSLERQQEPLYLELEDGRVYEISKRHIRLNVQSSTGMHALYRLHVLKRTRPPVD
jgi:hypothetical protein